MKVFEANITLKVSKFLNEILKPISSFENANQKMYDAFGILHFFESNEELERLKEVISETEDLVNEPDRAEYGDFQTNIELASNAALYLKSKNISPEIVIEPTCGKGNFIIASLKTFKKINNVVGVEIYKPYVWETKFNIIEFYLNNPQNNKPDISIHHCNVFDFDFREIARSYSKNKILIIGNPPWVTNSKLGILNSDNLPQKSNFKKHSGLDAMTGKGNFDIAEFITLMMIKNFELSNGDLFLLIKNSVIKNLLYDQNKNKYRIGANEKLCIDSKKEFGVSVEASLFYSKLNSSPEVTCKEFNFYSPNIPTLTFGWLRDKFVSNIEAYVATKEIDGICPFVWRQGLKHDCSKVMELEKENGYYLNGLKEKTLLENEMVYGLLKSSDLKNNVIYRPRKYTIVTQKKVGQETKEIKFNYPKTYQYLINHLKYFEARKSSIYRNKPLFSIFGIGDYSFKPFKVAISGLYKTFHFTLVLPQNDKPIMLDDTCYLLGFSKIEYAVYTLILLNSHKTKQFLKSITFSDAKRVFTKDVLMRIDLYNLARNTNQKELQADLDKLNIKYDFDLSLNKWDDFIDKLKPLKNSQIELFQ